MQHRIWRKLACAALVTIFSGAAAGADGPKMVDLLPSQISLPARIGPMRYTGTPHKYDDPRLGVSYQYGGDGLSLTVYVYDAGETDLVDGADTIATCREFEIAKQGVEQAYQKPVLKVEQLVRLTPPDDLPQMREAQYEFEREGNLTISFIWITTAANHFVKLRLSMNPRLRDELPEARRAVLAVVGDAIKPYLAAAKPKKDEKEGGSSVTFNLGGLGGDDSMEVGMWYVILLQAVVDKSPQLAPVCGGEVVPSLETELSIYRGMFAPDQDLAKSKVGKVMAQIDKAGFLEEYLWVDRHRESWGAVPPEGLTLPEYAAWRKKNLRKFNPPDFGTVALDHPRPLPLEPLTP
jgi:hypothetical protein